MSGLRPTDLRSVWYGRMAIIDRGLIGAFSEAPEAGFFQQQRPGVAWRYEVDAGDDAADGAVVEQSADDGPKGDTVHLIIGSGIEAIDADRPGLGNKIGGEVHLDGWVNFEQEEEAIVIENEVGAKGFMGLHAVIDLPESFIGKELGAGAIELVTEEFADDRSVGVF